MATDTGGKESLLVPSGHELPRMAAEENPTYDDAVGYVRDWTLDQYTAGDLLIEMKEDGFKAFGKRTSEEYNRAESGLLEMFEAILALIPGAGLLVGTLKLFQEGSRLVKAADAIEKLAEASKTAIEAGKAGETLAGSSGGGSGTAKGNFELAVLRELSDLNIDLVRQVRSVRDDLVDRLKVFQHVHAGIDLVGEVKKILGERPPNPPKTLAQQVRDRFEQELYKRFYFDSGRYTRNIYQKYSLRERKWVTWLVEHEGMPEKVVDYIEANKLWAFMARDEPVKVKLLKDSLLGTQVTELPVQGFLLAHLPVHAT